MGGSYFCVEVRLMREIKIDEKRDFKGLWIPQDVYMDNKLTRTERDALVEIINLCSLGDCFASNKHFAECLGIAKGTAANVIYSLRKKGYIEIELIYKAGSKEIDKRIIRYLDPYSQNNEYPIHFKMNTPIHEKMKEKNPFVKNPKEEYTHIGRSDTETQGGVVPYKKFEWNSWSQYNDYVDNKLKDDIYDIATKEELGMKETRKLYSLFRWFFLMHIAQGKGRHSIIQKPKLETIINRLYATDYICDGEGLDERGIFECMISFFKSNRKNDYSIYIFTESSTLNGLIGKVYGTGGEMYEEINQKRGVGYR